MYRATMHHQQRKRELITCSLDQKIAEVADEMQSLFEVGPLHSQSKIGVIARHAQEALADNGLPTRKSLCFDRDWETNM